VLKPHPVVLLEALCGGQTVAAALSAANEEDDRIVPSAGFTIIHTISNLLLVTWQPVIAASPRYAN